MMICALTILTGTLLCAEEPAPNPLAVLMQTLGKIENPESQVGILRGMNASLQGRRGVAVPAGWPALYKKLQASPSAEVRRQAQALAATLGSGAALDEMRKTLGDPLAGVDARTAALDTLLAAKDAPTLPLLLDLAAQPGPLRTAALRGLAAYDDARIPAQILTVFPQLEAVEKREAVHTLLARAASARALLAAIDAQALDHAVISASGARQLQSLHDAGIDAWMTRHWGEVRTSSADKQKEIAKFKEFLGTDAILRANAAHGRVLFQQTCAVCHTLFGEGAKLGPELPGAFDDVDYLLQNIVDPNAIIGKDYQQTFVEMKDRRVLSGILASDDATTVTLKTLAGPVTVPRAEIKTIETSPASLMPEGLLAPLDEDSVRALFLYLRQKPLQLPTSR
ncbi:MAG: c-type cytochrome [Chthoniobacter sp.]|nr:c-type cytochrome [Chthoniobacter sp.]